jgi:enoyl-CoA hydratase|eukprot:g8170.t1
MLHGLRQTGVQALRRSGLRRPPCLPKFRSLVTVTEHGDNNEIACIKMDDGKMNAFSFEMIKEVHNALDTCKDAGAVVYTGNEKCLSAGFDLSVMGKGPSKDAGEMLRQGCDLMIRIAEFPRPILLAVTGHAMALGAILLFTGDLRVGPAGSNAKVGLNEVHIGMPLPKVGIELARWRLAPNYLSRATTLGNIYTPEEAVHVGYLDEVVAKENVVDYTIEQAGNYSGIKTVPFKATKDNERQAMLDLCRIGMVDDVAMFSG